MCSPPLRGGWTIEPTALGSATGQHCSERSEPVRCKAGDESCKGDIEVQDDNDRLERIQMKPDWALKRDPQRHPVRFLAGIWQDRMATNFGRVGLQLGDKETSTSARRQFFVFESGRVSTIRTTSPIFAVFSASWAWNFVERRTTFLYRGWAFTVSTRTTIVLSIALETTTPRRSWRRPRSWTGFATR